MQQYPIGMERIDSLYQIFLNRSLHKDPALNNGMSWWAHRQSQKYDSGSIGSEVINTLGRNCPSGLFQADLHKSQHFCNKNYWWWKKHSKLFTNFTFQEKNSKNISWSIQITWTKEAFWRKKKKIKGGGRESVKARLQLYSSIERIRDLLVPGFFESYFHCILVRCLHLINNKLCYCCLWETRHLCCAAWSLPWLAHRENNTEIEGPSKLL